MKKRNHDLAQILLAIGPEPKLPRMEGYEKEFFLGLLSKGMEEMENTSK